ELPPLEVVPQIDTASAAPPKRSSNKKVRYAAAAIAVVLISGVLYLKVASSQHAGATSKSPSELIVTRLTNGTAPLDATISPKGDYFVYHEQDGETAHLWLQQT